MDRSLLSLSKIVLTCISVFLLLLTCENNLLVDIREDVTTASVISPPEVTGSVITNDPTPTWSWNPIADAEFYRYGYAVDVWIESSSTVLSFTPPAALDEGLHTLYVQSGKSSDIWSEAAAFTTEIDLTPPAVPVVTGLTPTNITSPEWTWIPVSDAVRYRYGFSEVSWISQDAEATSYTQVLSEGSHILYVQAQDAAGNWSASGNFTITIDLSVLSPPVLTGPSFTNSTTPTWDWNDVPDAVKYRYGFTDGEWISETSTVSQYTSASVLGDGTHTLYVQVCNDLGTWSSSAGLVLTVDTIAPAAPAVSGTTPTSNLTPSWDWNDVPGAVKYRYGYSDGVWITEEAAESSFTAVSPLTESDYTLFVQAADEAGNWSAAGSWTITIDLSVPESPVVTGPDYTNDTTPTWDWNDVPGAVRYRYGYSDGIWLTENAVSSDYTESAPIVSDGIYTLYVQAQNGAGTWSSSGFYSIVIDTLAPADPVVTGTSPTNITTPTWNWSDVSGAAFYRYGYSEGVWITEIAVLSEYTPATSLDESDYTLYVQAGDNAGNWSGTGSFTISLDLSAPVISGFTSSNTPAKSHTWTWDSDDVNAEYRYIINTLPDVITVWSGSSWNSAEEASFDSVTGTYYLHLQARDTLGNLSGESLAFRIFDNTPPDPPTVSGPASTGISRPTWTWDVPADTNLFRYQLDSESAGGWITVGNSTTSYQPSVAEKLSEGSYTLYVQTADLLNNWSASDSHTITVSIDPPVTPVPSSGSNLMDLTPLLDWESPSYANAYHIQINEAADFSGAMVAESSIISSSDYQIAANDGLTPGGTYYWRVKVQNADGVWGGSWSTVWSFSIADSWAMTIGGTDNDSVNAIIQTSDGGIVMTGYTYSYGTGGDLWILKVDALGEVEWQKSIGGIDGAEYGFDIMETADNGFIIAGNGKYSDVVNYFVHPWIIKLSSTGTVESEKLFYGIYDEEIYSIQQTSDSGYIVSGFTTDFSADSEDAWILKLNSSFAVTWQNTYGGTSTSGYDRARAIRQTSDGGYITVGNTASFTSGSTYEAWIMKLNSNGTVNWAKCYGRASYDDIFYDVKETSDGGYIAVGISKISGSNFDYLVLKVDTDGVLEWIENIGGTWEEAAFTVDETSGGDFIIAGFTDTYTVADDGTDDAWILKLSSTGAIIWQKAFGDSGSTNDFFNGAVLTADGDILAGGYTTSFGEGLNDAWIIRMKADGDCSTLDRDTSATITATGLYSDPGNLSGFTETSNTVTVTSTTVNIGDTSAYSTETDTTATINFQVP